MTINHAQGGMAPSGKKLKLDERMFTDAQVCS